VPGNALESHDSYNCGVLNRGTPARRPEAARQDPRVEAQAARSAAENREIDRNVGDVVDEPSASEASSGRKTDTSEAKCQFFFKQFKSRRARLPRRFAPQSTRPT
jgi:hypothetical protein